MVQTKCIMYLHHGMRAHFAAGYEAPRNNWQRTDKWTLKYATAITSYEHI